MEEMLCPLKKNTQTEKDFKLQNNRKSDFTSVVSFGTCEKEKCAWWRDDKRCAVLNIADAIEYIACNK